MEMGTDTGPQRIWGYLATGNYFDVLGVRPVLGRFFNQSEDRHPGGDPYAVLSYSAWRSRFGADPAIVGKTIRLNRLPYTVLGVAPPDFHGTELFYWPEVWVPMMMEPRIESNAWLDERDTWNTWIVGRLKPKVSPTQAEADLNAVAAEMARQFPDVNGDLHFKVTKPGLIGNTVGTPAKAFALGVLVLAALVLLAACTNLAGMGQRAFSASRPACRCPSCALLCPRVRLLPCLAGTSASPRDEPRLPTPASRDGGVRVESGGIYSRTWPRLSTTSSTSHPAIARRTVRCVFEFRSAQYRPVSHWRLSRRQNGSAAF